MRKFVSMVRRTTRINTKLENLSLALLSCSKTVSVNIQTEGSNVMSRTNSVIATAIRISAMAVDIDHN